MTILYQSLCSKTCTCSTVVFSTMANNILLCLAEENKENAITEPTVPTMFFIDDGSQIFDKYNLTTMRGGVKL